MTTPTFIPPPAPPPGPPMPLPARPTLPRRQHHLIHLIRAEGAGLSVVLLCLVLVQYLAIAPVYFVLALALALVPLPPLIALVLWTDRYEPEPVGLLLRTFLWGAGVATFFAIIANTVAGGIAGEATAVTVSAPVVEETLKGLALFYVLRRAGGVLDGIHDGVIYAVMVGLGFAAVENVGYYVTALLREGEQGLVGTFVLRGLFSPLAHPVFTSCTGIGVGLAARTAAPVLRRVYPLLGLCGAITLHHAWNASTGNVDSFALTYFAGYVPLVIGLVAFLVVGSVHQRRVLRRELQPEVVAGRLTPLELAHLTARGLHRRRLNVAARHAGADAADAWTLYQMFAAELAAFRARGMRHLDRREAAALDAEYLCGLERARARVWAFAPTLLAAPVVG